MELSPAHEQLKALFSQYLAVSDLVWEQCLPAWQPYSAPRRTLLTIAGERERYLYFVTEGIQRVYFLADDGDKEATLVFTYAPSLSGVADAFLSQQASRFYLETITPSSFIRISYEQFIRHCDDFPVMNTLLRIMTGAVLEGILLRQAELQMSSAEAKFKALLQRSPHVLNLIPHKYLASYLGIDPTTFSKLLGKIRL